MKTIFEYAENEKYGFNGFKMLSKSYAEPVLGMGCAHDILEHFPKDTGTVEDELQALGACILVRDFGTYYALNGNIHPLHVHLASDFVVFFEYLTEFNHGYTIRDPGKVKEHAEIVEILNKTIEQAAVNLAEELSEQYGFEEYSALENLNRMRGWIAKGYDRALRRYKKNEPENLCFLFTEIEKQVNKISRICEIGDRIAVEYSLQTYKVNVEVIYESQI